MSSATPSGSRSPSHSGGTRSSPHRRAPAASRTSSSRITQQPDQQLAPARQPARQRHDSDDGRTRPGMTAGRATGHQARRPARRARPAYPDYQQPRHEPGGWPQHSRPWPAAPARATTTAGSSSTSAASPSATRTRSPASARTAAPAAAERLPRAGARPQRAAAALRRPRSRTTSRAAICPSTSRAGTAAARAPRRPRRRLPRAQRCAQPARGAARAGDRPR